jgi:hypothetical protein
MIRPLVLSVLIYLIWTALYLQRKRIRKFFFLKKKIPSEKNPTLWNEDEIMGKTKTQTGQFDPNNDMQGQFKKPIEKAAIFAPSNEKSKSPVVENSELDTVFSDSPEPIELDVELEFRQEELLEEEELICFWGDEKPQSSAGIQFDDMIQMVQAIQKNKPSEAVEQRAVNTLLQMDQTELFQQVISQIEGGKQRVVAMLDKYKVDAFEENPFQADTPSSDFQQFEITDFL